jgi:PhnB protein
MTTAHKPNGYPSVSPYVIVDGAAATIDFLRRTFGAVEQTRIADDGGRVRHAEVRIDDSVIMVADSLPEWPAGRAHVHVYVPDVDAAYRRALDAGATSVQAPAKRDDPDKRGGVKDASGTTWWIATRVE